MISEDARKWTKPQKKAGTPYEVMRDASAVSLPCGFDQDNKA